MTVDSSSKPSNLPSKLQSNDVFRRLVSSVVDYAIFVLDPAGHIASWNLGAERLKGYKADEIIGKHFSLFYTQPDLDTHKPDYELMEADSARPEVTGNVGPAAAAMDSHAARYQAYSRGRAYRKR